MADTATSDQAAKPTLASATALAGQALESAQLAHQVAESLTASVTAKMGKAATEQLALTQAVGLMTDRLNTLTSRVGQLAAAPATAGLDGLLARLEQIEERTKGEVGDWAPVIKAQNERLHKYGEQLGQLTIKLEDAATADEMYGGDTLAARVDEAFTQIQALYEAQAVLLAGLREVAAPDAVLPAGPQVPTGGNTASAKVLELMRLIPNISKDRDFESKQAKFKFRGIDQAMDWTGWAMREVGLTLRTKVLDRETTQDTVTKQGNSGSYDQRWTTTLLTMRYVFVDPVTEHEHEFEMVGEGRDVADKSASKAASMACKYALFQALMIPVAGLNDTDSDSEQPVIEGERLDFHQRGQRTSPGSTDSPGRQVSQGRMTPADAVDAYAKRGHTGDAAGAVADGPAAEDDSLMQRAAKAAYYLRSIQSEPAAVALPKIKATKDRIAQLGIGDMLVSLSADGSDQSSLDNMVTAALQSVTAVLDRPAGGQGVTRSAQQAGDGVRAAAQPRLDISMTAGEQQYREALKALADPNAPDDVLSAADAIVQRWEAAHGD